MSPAVPRALLGVAAALVTAVMLVTVVPAVVLLLVLGGGPPGQACGAQPPPGGGGLDWAGLSDAAGTPVGPQPALRSPEDLNDTQRRNAATVVAVGERRGVGEQGIVIALATVAQESTFWNYANDGRGTDLAPEQRGVERSRTFPHDKVGTEHGSIGIVQQQWPWWGSMEQLMDPATAIGLFYDKLLEVPGWQGMPVTRAAQTVQRSAFPSAYERWEPLARALHAMLAGTSSAGGSVSSAALAGGQLCGPGLAMSCPATGLAAERGLTPDALRVLRCVQQQFGDHTYGGVGKRSNNPRSDHPAGRAVDVMIDAWTTAAGNAHGWQVARWVQGNAAGLGVTYVIFDRTWWKVGDPLDAWNPYRHPSGRSDPNLDHTNHVHVSVHGNAAAQIVPAAAGAAPVAGGWTLPLAPGSYRISSGYGLRRDPTGLGTRLHAGLDFAAPSGTPVFAATSGTVTTAGPSGGYGNLVVVTSGTIATYYAHHSTLAVTAGQQVQAGQLLGAVGSTGKSTGPHLHFEVRVAGATTDPAAWLRSYGLDPG